MQIAIRYTTPLYTLSAALIAAIATAALTAQPSQIKSPVPIDFSYAGYGAGRAIPSVKPILTVKPSGADDTAVLQGALDRIAAAPLNADGFRGALQLAPGRFHVKGHLHLRATGVVLRGSTAAASPTTIVAEGIDRRPLIQVGADNDPALDPSIQVQSDAPAGTRLLHLASIAGLKVGDHVVVRRPSTQEWNTAMSMTGLPGTFASQRLDWRPGSHDLVWDRTLTSVNAQTNSVELDAPITTALELKWGGGTLAPVSGEPAPHNIGIENLILDSAYDPTLPKDEEHSWIAILIDHAEDTWVRNVTARHFVTSAVRVNLRGRRITIENCRSQSPVSEEGGYRRQSFFIAGQQVFVYRCHSEKGMNDFASGMLAGGPNVFFDCDATASLGASGPFEGWTSGVLYENIHLPNARLQMIMDFSRAQGAGWTAANSLIWNSTATSLEALGPPAAQNFIVNSSQPLYQTQLLARTGRKLSPTEPALIPATPTLAEFKPADIKPAPAIPPAFHPVSIVNGRFVIDGNVLWGTTQTEAWWHGDTSIYTAAVSSGSSVSRFMPGVIAPGETEDLHEMVARLLARGAISIQINPGLWYDHRRDSHSVERRPDGDVWAPFYEAPWARSGKGIAWDGLSKFDLSRFNPWYFQRQREFGLQASEAGLIVFYNLYNTHNVLEIGPHWIDYAWRPANNINDTGLPEPPPFKPHGRNDVANQFYSTAYAPLRALHRAYILHTLDQLADMPNIIFGIAYQYAGPLAFEQFFQDTVREWEQAHGKHVRIALTTSKQITDAILQDPIRSKQIAVVDMRYWEYLSDGSLFAPRAGENRAFREQIAAAFPGYTNTPPPTTPQQVYRQVREYRDRYPGKALMPMEAGTGPIPILMAGAASESGLRTQAPTLPPTEIQNASAMYPQAIPGSRAPGPPPRQDQAIADFIHKYLSTQLVNISPKDGWVVAPDRTWVLAGTAPDPVLIYSLSGADITLATQLPVKQYNAIWFNPRSGDTQSAHTITPTPQSALTKPDTQDWLLLLIP